ncbi:hypothetical protein Taro_047358, partial [Colocasia esculenta]|nr:hypothetical protein [Colocasia esculenta]
INTATTRQLELSGPTPGKAVIATTTSNRHSSHNNSSTVPIRITTVVARGGKFFGVALSGCARQKLISGYDKVS